VLQTRIRKRAAGPYYIRSGVSLVRFERVSWIAPTSLLSKKEKKSQSLKNRMPPTRVLARQRYITMACVRRRTVLRVRSFRPRPRDIIIIKYYYYYYTRVNYRRQVYSVRRRKEKKGNCYLCHGVRCHNIIRVLSAGRGRMWCTPPTKIQSKRSETIWMTIMIIIIIIITTTMTIDVCARSDESLSPGHFAKVARCIGTRYRRPPSRIGIYRSLWNFVVNTPDSVGRP